MIGLSSNVFFRQEAPPRLRKLPFCVKIPPEMLSTVLLLTAALRAPDEFPPLQPGGEEGPGPARGTFAGACSMWLALSELSIGADLSMEGLAVPFPVRLVYKRGKDVYELGLWQLNEESSGSRMSLGFYKLAWRKIVWDRKGLRFFIDAGLDLLDLDANLKSSTDSDSLDELIPVLNVGLEVEWRIAPEVFLNLRTTGLSWSELLGVQGDAFSIQGRYRHFETGVLWRTSLRTYVGASFRFIQLGYDSSGRSVELSCLGLSLTARYWW